ncbi:MAG: type II toxin-antitoxin system VapC family toxin [Catenulisporales bacterium]|nr:type II toxin-antitoxin system VapC family toxin [Catenulisporales bacterium]
MIYLDSCALVKLVLTEKETPALTTFLADRRSDMVSSQLALTEVIRVVRRSCYDSQRRLSIDPAVRDKRLATAASLLDRIDLVIVNRSLLLAAAAFDDDPHVGSLDAIHLASARELDDALESFVTYDKTLARAAAAVGLPLEQPS